MFLLRSAFWLALAFLVIRPEMDMRGAASALSAEAMAQGSAFVTSQIEAIECDTFTCVGGKAVVAAALQPVPQAGTPMHAQPSGGPVPLPRPRPSHAG